MSRDDENAVLAVKNAWLGVVKASEEVVSMLPAVDGLAPETDPAALDFETYERIVGAQANAVMGLRGLIEDIKRKSVSAE